MAAVLQRCVYIYIYIYICSSRPERQMRREPKGRMNPSAPQRFQHDIYDNDNNNDNNIDIQK